MQLQPKLIMQRSRSQPLTSDYASTLGRADQLPLSFSEATDDSRLDDILIGKKCSNHNFCTQDYCIDALKERMFPLGCTKKGQWPILYACWIANPCLVLELWCVNSSRTERKT